MKIQSRLRQAAFKRNYWIDKLDSKNELSRFLMRFRERYISCDLVRVGADQDGGYLHPENLETISYCFSPGVARVAEFEKDLSERFNIKSFMADASVKKPPISGPNFNFIPYFIGASTHNQFITLSDWIDEALGYSEGRMILQMDIEGAEYDVLIFEDSSVLSRFSTMTIEFHHLERMFQKNFLRMFSAIFDKIFKNFSICHVHPNNCCGVASLDGISVPRVMEVTFIRNDLIDEVLNDKKIELPHLLDRKNVQRNDEILMPEIWWKK